MPIKAHRSGASFSGFGDFDLMIAALPDAMDGLLARYVAGTLPLPAHVLIESHLQLSNANRQFANDLAALAGEEMDGLAPSALSQRDERLAAILGSSPAIAKPARPVDQSLLFPRALYDFAGFDAADTPWKTKLPGFREYDFGEIDGVHATLYWIKPGRAVPEHTHEGSELTVVVDGAFRDINGRYGRGDVAMADGAVDHRPIAETERPCISFAVTDAPLRLTGSFRRRLGDLLGR